MQPCSTYYTQTLTNTSHQNIYDSTDDKKKIGILQKKNQKSALIFQNRPYIIWIKPCIKPNVVEILPTYIKVMVCDKD